jgi:group I intron endonuclease
MSIYQSSTGIIYCYTNTVTGKKYIGQTIHPEHRKRSHLHEAMTRNSNYYFHRSIRKHGWNMFVYEVLEEVDRELLNVRELHHIQTLNTLWPDGYNQSLANALNETSIRKMSETKKQRFAEMTEEERKSLTEKLCKSNIGKKRSEETRKKMSESAKRHLKEKPRVRSEETKKKTSESMKKYLAENPRLKRQ